MIVFDRLKLSIDKMIDDVEVDTKRPFFVSTILFIVSVVVLISIAQTPFQRSVALVSALMFLSFSLSTIVYVRSCAHAHNRTLKQIMAYELEMLDCGVVGNIAHISVFHAPRPDAIIQLFVARAPHQAGVFMGMFVFYISDCDDSRTVPGFEWYDEIVSVLKKTSCKAVMFSPYGKKLPVCQTWNHDSVFLQTEEVQ